MRGARIRLDLRDWGVVVAACIACAASPSGAAAEAPVQPYGTNDASGFRNVLPAGENGPANATQGGEFELTGAVPPHLTDQPRRGGKAGLDRESTPLNSKHQPN